MSKLTSAVQFTLHATGLGGNAAVFAACIELLQSTFGQRRAVEVGAL